MSSATSTGTELSRGVRAGLVAYTLWGLLTIYWKQLTGFDALELIGWRIACAAVTMAGVVTVRHRWRILATALRTPAVVARIAVAAVLLTANWTAYVVAVTGDNIIETALGYFMAPLGTMLLGITVLHERPSSLQRIALGCAAFAVVVLTVSYGRPPVLALIIAVSWSLYGLCKRRVPLTPIESLASETFVLAVPALALTAILARGDSSVPATASGADWAFVLLTGVVTAVPLLLFAVAAQRVPFTILGPLQYLVPTINFALGWLVYGEALPADRFVGFALVWLALVAVSVDHLRSAPAAARGALPRYEASRAR